MIFELTDGRRFVQTSHQHEYGYQYRPDALLDLSGDRGRLKIDGMDDWVDVKSV